jgi:hypothetical protein
VGSCAFQTKRLRSRQNAHSCHSTQNIVKNRKAHPFQSPSAPFKQLWVQLCLIFHQTSKCPLPTAFSNQGTQNFVSPFRGISCISEPRDLEPSESRSCNFTQQCQKEKCTHYLQCLSAPSNDFGFSFCLIFYRTSKCPFPTAFRPSIDP